MVQRRAATAEIVSSAAIGADAIGCHGSERSEMRAVITVMAILFLAATVSGQAVAKGKRQQQAAPKAEDLTKKKAAEDAYKNALKSIPVSNEKPDPWKAMR